jgi:hypothetical protein
MIYRAIRDEKYNLLVTVHGKPLNYRLDIAQHSPSGFDCGYGGLGPAQLALAILAEHLDDDVLALRQQDALMWNVIAKLPREGWELTGKQVDEACPNH